MIFLPARVNREIGWDNMGVHIYHVLLLRRPPLRYMADVISKSIRVLLFVRA
tara:strand:+ start:3093 stop:3248 length:156 start_codon:yes stop_codon:yes gene_type:complete